MAASSDHSDTSCFHLPSSICEYHGDGIGPAHITSSSQYPELNHTHKVPSARPQSLVLGIRLWSYFGGRYSADYRLVSLIGDIHFSQVITGLLLGKGGAYCLRSQDLYKPYLVLSTFYLSWKRKAVCAFSALQGPLLHLLPPRTWPVHSQMKQEQPRGPETHLSQMSR